MTTPPPRNPFGGPLPADAYQAILDELRTVRVMIDASERARIEGQGELRAWRASVDQRLHSIEGHARATNGKVAALEEDRIAREAVARATPAIRQEAVAEARPTIQHDAVESTRARYWKGVAAGVSGASAIAMVAIGVLNLTT